MTVEERLVATAFGNVQASQVELARAHNLLAGVPSFDEEDLKKLSAAYHAVGEALGVIRNELDRSTERVIK